MNDNQKKTLALTGMSVALSLTATAVVYSVTRWAEKNITKAHDLPKGDEKPFPNSLFYERGDYRIHYRIDKPKKGKTKGKIFMIHGFGCSTVFFNETVEILTEKGYMCVRADVPNFGYSTRESENVNPIDRDELMFDIMSIISPDEKWILMGHSMGGGIALNLALYHPEKFSALILYGPMLAATVPEFVCRLAREKGLCKVLDVVIQYGGGCKPLIKSVLTVATKDKDYMDEKFDINLATDTLSIKGMGTGLCYMFGNAKQQPYSEMKNIKLPTYLVWGEKDVLMTKGMAKRLQESLYNPEVCFMYGGGHCMIQNRAEEVVDGTMRFFEKHGL